MNLALKIVFSEMPNMALFSCEDEQPQAMSSEGCESGYLRRRKI
jgi:hypothetical protein